MDLMERIHPIAIINGIGIKETEIKSSFQLTSSDILDPTKTILFAKRC